ncbi:MAG: ribonuclease P protein component [SAR324 cluster bacterium]|nr:ribonuclease P protein component [SAR324 cluster bacterium]
MGYSFPKCIRLRKKTEIDRVFDRGAFRRFGFIRIKFLITTLGNSRYLVSVSKKVGHSPYRNHIKRLIREAIRLHRSELEQSCDICIFVTNRPQSPVPFSYVDNKIAELFAELNRLQAPAI